MQRLDDGNAEATGCLLTASSTTSMQRKPHLMRSMFSPTCLLPSLPAEHAALCHV